MTSSEYRVGRMTSSDSAGNVHAVAPDSESGGRALCGARVDEIDADGTFPPGGSDGATPCPACEDEIRRMARELG